MPLLLASMTGVAISRAPQVARHNRKACAEMAADDDGNGVAVYAVSDDSAVDGDADDGAD